MIRSIRLTLAGLLVAAAWETTFAQFTPSFLQEAPEPLTDELISEEVGARTEAATAIFSNISAKYSGRAAAIFDVGRLNDFANGTFMPAAIPVQDENFYDFGERAMVQGNGSAVRIAVSPTSREMPIAAEALFVVEDFSSASAGNFGLSSRAFIQYNRLVVGLTETAFTDPECLVPILDLAGPNARATVLSPNGGGGQGRLSCYLYPSGDANGPIVGNLSLEMPTPEIQFTAGQTPQSTFAPYSRFPDFIMTWKYQVEDAGHMQLGTVFRDLALQNGDHSINDSTFGWGIQLSGAIGLCGPNRNCPSDGIGYSIVVGDGIGHYINDLHVVATGQRSGGNDAILNGTQLEALPAQAYYVGYLHNWSDMLHSSLGYSRVNLDSVPGQLGTAYRSGDYFVVNCVYHQDLKPNDAKVNHFYMGLEYLLGRKEVLSGNAGDAHRFMFVVNFSK